MYSVLIRGETVPRTKIHGVIIESLSGLTNSRIIYIAFCIILIFDFSVKRPSCRGSIKLYATSLFILSSHFWTKSIIKGNNSSFAEYSFM